MNVDTLLEAAKYLEEQEEKAKQQRQIQITPDILTRIPIIHQQQDHIQFQQQQMIQHIQTNHHQQLSLNTSVNKTSKMIEHSSPTLTMTTVPPATKVIKNSFDIINRLVIDETGEQKRKQPPIVFRAGTREVHNKLEKDRRAHLKECFDLLKKQLPKAQDERKSSNLSILHSAIRYINSLKKRERDLEHEMEQLARQKIAYQQKMAVLKKDLSGGVYDGLDFAAFSPEIVAQASATHGVVVDEAMEGAGAPVEIKMEIGPVEIKMEADEPVLIENNKAIKNSVVAIPRSIAQAQQRVNGVKEFRRYDDFCSQNAQVQTTALSVLPLHYPMSQVVLQKVALVPKNLTDLSPLVPSPAVAHLITPQQIGGKVVPIVNAQYVVKPVVVVSTPSRPS